MILSPPYLTCFSRRNTIAGQSDEHSMYLNLQNEFCATIQIAQLIPIRPTPRSPQVSLSLSRRTWLQQHSKRRAKSSVPERPLKCSRIDGKTQREVPRPTR